MTPKKGWKLGDDSSMKMIVWFKDGNVRTMYSIDWKHKFSKQKDPTLGLERFRKLVKKYGILAGTIAVYDKATGELLEKYYQGERKPVTKNEVSKEAVL